MEHNPIQTMLHEHDVITSTEHIIKSLDGHWNTDADKYKSTVEALVHFFREYADGYHHRKEEEILFPAINNHPDFVLQEIVEEFETHHEDFREYATEILDALSSDEFGKAYKVLTTYLNDLLDHIGAENDELFVLAETLMDEGDLETIYFKFKDIDMELGEERKVELENSLTQIAL
ncbi:MAG: hemerythrin domain-containing protein [Flavobacteriales bacterium]|nr:hemerythrin domain-containing protein [Flavobacteriales bacterium]